MSIRIHVLPESMSECLSNRILRLGFHMHCLCQQLYGMHKFNDLLELPTLPVLLARQVSANLSKLNLSVCSESKLLGLLDKLLELHRKSLLQM